MLAWIKRRVREFEGFDWANEDGYLTPRRDYIKAAIEDWQWMTSGGCVN